MGTLWQDVRYGFRALRKSPGFTAVAVVALALGIGATTAIFSVVNTVLLRPLPFAAPERLTAIWQTHPFAKKLGYDHLPTTPADFTEWRRSADAFEELSALAGGNWNMTGGDAPERVSGARVSTNLLRMLRTQPALGRDFAADEETFGKNRVVILSHNFWQSHFGGDPRILGRQVTLDGNSFEIIGVMPKDFSFPRGMGIDPALGLDDDLALWTPLALPPGEAESRANHFIATIGRLKAGATMEQARAQLTAVERRLEQANPAQGKDWDVTIGSLHEQVVGKSRRAILLLLGAVALVLLIACANVANLLLARANARHKEIAIRTALGAGRARIVRQLLTESVLLALVGGTLGVLLAMWGVDVLVVLGAGNVPRAAEIGIDSRVLLFTLTVSLATGLLFGLAPALQSSRPNLNESLKEGSRGGGASSPRRQRVRSALVVAEVALALVLLVGAGLLLKSFARLQNVNPGFDYRDVLTATMFLPDARYKDEASRALLYKQVLERVKNLPGVESVGGVSQLPLGGSEEVDGLNIEGRPRSESVDTIMTAAFRVVSPDYFRTLRIPLLRGRYFTEQDTADAQGVMIVDETFARRYFPDDDPIGKRVDEQGSLTPKGYMTIIGVVASVRHTSLDAESKPTMYLSSEQSPWHTMVLTVRSKADPATLAAAIRREVAAVDPAQPVSDVQTFEQVFSRAVAPQRFNSTLLAVFAALAMILATVGIYGVIAYTVSQRAHEMGVRIALGARTSDILRLVVGQAMTMTLIGIALGLGASLALTRMMSSLLFEVSANDPSVFAGVALLLAAVALAASLIPARRATKVDPVVALRHE